MKKLLLLLITLLVLMGCSETEIITYSESYIAVNTVGMTAMEEGRPEDAEKQFKKMTLMSPEHAVGFNNLGWALNELQEFELAIEALQSALALEPNDSYAFSNMGNSYSALNQEEEAIEAYNSAIEFDESNSYAYYGLAILYKQSGQYDLAIENYDLSLKYMPTDTEAITNKLDCMVSNNRYGQALIYIDEVLEEFDNYHFNEIKGLILENSKSEEDVVAFYEKLALDYPEEINTSLNLGLYYYNMGDNNKALKALKVYADDRLSLSWQSRIYHELGNIDMAISCANKNIQLYPDDYNAYESLGDIYYYNTDYFTAIDYYKKGLSLVDDPRLANSVVYTLIEAGRYQGAIDQAIDYLVLFESDYDLLSNIALAYYRKNDFSQAINYINEINEIDYDVTMEYFLSQSYYDLGDFNNALVHVEIYLEEFPADQEALDLKKSITEYEKFNVLKIKSYFDQYYLYDYNQSVYKKFIDPLYDEDVVDLIQQSKHKDDLYTFVLMDADYDYVSDVNNNPLNYQLLDDKQVYVTFDRFDENIDHLFIEMLDSFEETEEMDLILDLRYNSGGSTNSANNILDALLPELLVSQFIYRDGTAYANYSSQSQVKFNHIYILTSEQTASASELIILGLKTYLNEVTIIGQQTFGKGVGQNVFEDKVNKRIYYIVSHFWNVREQNINEKGIRPDITVNSDNLQDYLNKIK